MSINPIAPVLPMRFCLSWCLRCRITPNEYIVKDRVASQPLCKTRCILVLPCWRPRIHRVASQPLYVFLCFHVGVVGVGVFDGPLFPKCFGVGVFDVPLLPMCFWGWCLRCPITSNVFLGLVSSMSHYSQCVFGVGVFDVPLLPMCFLGLCLRCPSLPMCFWGWCL